MLMNKTGFLQQRLSVYGIFIRLAFGVAVVCGLSGCGGSQISSLDRQRGAPGEVFTIRGSKLKDDLSAPAPVPPILKRCDEITLEVLEWNVDSIRVRIPPNVPAGLYQVYAFGTPLGAYERPRTNAVSFWVTAAPVADAVTDSYEVQVKSFRTHYSKSAEWEAWMLANRDRYQSVFNAAHAVPCPVGIATSYETPLAYNPPWSSEAEHMTALNRVADLMYPGYHFNFSLSLTPSNSYARAILGQTALTSYADAGVVHLHYETIFGHEFGHLLSVQHHYEGDTGGSGLHFPPGETHCLMDRNSNQYCSACRTALNLPLDINNGSEIDAAVTNILSRDPPGW
jgi:hypothetical protein